MVNAGRNDDCEGQHLTVGSHFMKDVRDLGDALRYELDPFRVPDGLILFLPGKNPREERNSIF